MEYVCSVCNKTTAELFISGLSTGAKPSAYIKVKADTPAVNKFLLPSFGIPVNYQLLGYSMQANATKKEYTTGTTVSIPADGKLYAVVVPREYTVVYHDIPYSSDGTESEVHTADVDFEIEHKYLDDEPFRWCRGWSKTKNASEPTFVYGKRYDYKLIISAQDLSDSNPNNNTVHLYPVWGDKKFTVRYEWYTGAQEVDHDSVNDYLTKGEVVPPATYNGCQFIGWATNYDSAYVFSSKNRIADILPLMNYDESTLYAIYGNQGDAPEYILDSQFENPVWIDGRNVSIFIRKDNIIQVLNEASSWGGKDDTTDGTSTDGYPMLEQIRNALYFGGSGYSLSDVCNVLNSDINKVDTCGLLYLEIRILNTFDGVSLVGIYENHVAPRHDGGSWYNLDPAVKNVMIISFDPYIDVDGKKVRQHELIQSISDITKKPSEWRDPKDLWNAFDTTMEEVSYGNVKYIIEKENIYILDEFPKDTSGNSYKAADYLQTLKDAINWMNAYNASHVEKKGWADCPYWLNFSHNPEAPYDPKDPYDVEPNYFTFDYDGYFKRFDVYNKVNNKEIDEVWIFIGPRVGLKAYESMMTGKDAYWINGDPLVKKGQRNFATYGFNFERGLDCMLENAGHRMEFTMDRVFFGGYYNPITEANYDGKTYDQLNDWEKFCACDFLTKGSIVAGVGNVHCGPNAKKDYNWDNSAQVKSYCDNWYNYPDISGNYRYVDSSEWSGTQEGHHIWWFRHIPHVAGYNNGKRNNWWEYFNFDDLQ